jgi:protein-disulfide isomerase
VIAAASSLLWTNLGKPLLSRSASRELAVPAAPLTLDGAQISGRLTAPVGIVEYSDFQCPYCAQFARDVWPGLRSKYVDTGNLLLAFRNYPLAIHPFARAAAIGAACAGSQGKFWEMHDLLFRDPRQLNDSTLSGAASSVRLDLAQFEKCKTEQGISDLLKGDSDDARRLRISATPSFFLGYVRDGRQLMVRRTMVGAASLTDFAATVDALLSRTNERKDE